MSRKQKIARIKEIITFNEKKYKGMYTSIDKEGWRLLIEVLE